MPRCPPACRTGPFSTPRATNILEFQRNLSKTKPSLWKPFQRKLTKKLIKLGGNQHAGGVKGLFDKMHISHFSYAKRGNCCVI